MAAAVDDRPCAVAAIAPVVTPALLDFDQEPENYAPWLPGLSDRAFARQWKALQAAPRWDAAAHASQIEPRPLLVIHARYDRVVPLTQSQALLDAAHDPRKLVVHDEANHSFTGLRPWLRGQILEWLDGLGLAE
jgi:fermentation-respiration switch protein FrsA (DUF1100 family)